MGVSEEAVAAVAALVEEAKAAHLGPAGGEAGGGVGDGRAVQRHRPAGPGGVDGDPAGPRDREDRGRRRLRAGPHPAAGRPGAGRAAGHAGAARRSNCSRSGALRLKWTCKNPRNATGTMYQVSRQVRHRRATARAGRGSSRSASSASGGSSTRPCRPARRRGHLPDPRRPLDRGRRRGRVPRQLPPHGPKIGRGHATSAAAATRWRRERSATEGDGDTEASSTCHAAEAENALARSALFCELRATSEPALPVLSASPR